MRTLSIEEWQAEGRRRFGDNMDDWKFVCPACKHVASVKDWKDANAPEGAIAFSCIGRWTEAKREAFGRGEGPCDYAGGGLIGLNPVRVEGIKDPVFEFANVKD